MLIWPFLALTFLLLFGLGYLVFTLEKSAIIKNWDERRCEIAVMSAASYFKPSVDPRSDTQFSMDNFSFCTSRFIEKAVAILFSPFIGLFQATTSSAGIISQGIDIIRTILSKIKSQFEAFLDPLYRKYVATTYSIFAIFQHFRSAFERTNAIVLSMLFASLSIIRGLLNMKDFVVKIVLIILGIMVAAIIVLFFVLFPFIPIIIIPTIAAIEVAVGSGAVSGMRDAFCLAPGTIVELPNKEKKKIENILPGENEGFIEAVIETSGKNVELWDIDGIIISSYHIVWDNLRSQWVFAKNHSSAKKSNFTFDKLYCLTTKSRTFKVYGHSTNNVSLIVRDWEELENNDLKGNQEYESITKSLLSFVRCGSKITYNSKQNIPTNLFYKISGKLINISDIDEENIQLSIHSSINENDTICGICKRVELPDTHFIHTDTGIYRENNFLTGGYIMPITESGQIFLYNSDGIIQFIIQDMTEVGVKNLHKTYDFILSRINQTSLEMSIEC